LQDLSYHKTNCEHDSHINIRGQIMKQSADFFVRSAVTETTRSQSHDFSRDVGRDRKPLLPSGASDETEMSRPISTMTR